MSKDKKIYNQNPPQELINQLLKYYNQDLLELVIKQSKQILKIYTNSFLIYNILGAAQKKQGKIDVL